MFINLTPHAIRLRVDDSNEAIPLDTDIVIEPAPVTARVQTVQCLEVDHFDNADEVEGFPVYTTKYGAIEGLPQPIKGAIR